MSRGGVAVPELSAEFQQSSLYGSIRRGQPRLLLECLRQGEDCRLACSRSGLTLVHAVVLETEPLHEERYVPMVYLLSNAGADLSRRDGSGLLPVQMAIRRCLLQVSVALVKCGAEAGEDWEALVVKHTNYFQEDFVSSLRKLLPGLWTAVAENKTFKVNVLVKSWCRVNLSRNGQSLIEFAKTSNADPKIVRHLLDHEASIELAHAVMAGDEERVKHLLCNGTVDLNFKDLSYREHVLGPHVPLTIIGAAEKYNHLHLVSLLKSAANPASGPRSTSNGSVHNSAEQSAVCRIV